MSGVSGGRQAAAGYSYRPGSIKEPASHAQAFGPLNTRRVFNQIASRGLKQILDWEKALAESSNSTL
jgi:hypothetical protein